MIGHGYGHPDAFGAEVFPDDRELVGVQKQLDAFMGGLAPPVHGEPVAGASLARTVNPLNHGEFRDLEEAVKVAERGRPVEMVYRGLEQAAFLTDARQKELVEHRFGDHAREIVGRDHPAF